MCGIFSIISDHDITDTTLNGLKRLEYRGYDSAGMGGIVDHQLKKITTIGQIDQLIHQFKQNSFSSNITIAHTRWATHGDVTLNNAHPISNEHFMIVHNGIIENYQDILKKYQVGPITTQTDSESILHFCMWNRERHISMETLLEKALHEFIGNFTFLILDLNSQAVYCVKQGITITLGISYEKKSLYLASDVLSMSPYVKEFYVFSGSMYGVFKPHLDFQLFNEKGKPIHAHFEKVDKVYDLYENHKFAHQTLKEIYDQPTSILETMENYIDFNDSIIHFPSNILQPLKQHKTFFLTGCGAAYYAAKLGGYWLRNIGGVFAEAYLAPEMRYEPFLMHYPAPVIMISQSGETKDVLLTAEALLNAGRILLPIVNVPNSTLSRMAYPLYTLAFPEIGVSTTKAFSAQILTLYIIALSIAKEHNDSFSKYKYISSISDLKNIPKYMRDMLGRESFFKAIAIQYQSLSRVFFLARGDLIPIAEEAALKLKEIAYLDVTTYSATEMKHGPIALVDNNLLAIVLIPNNQFFSKTVSNIQEILVREGHVLVLSDDQGIKKLKQIFHNRIEYLVITKHKDHLAPFVYVIATQLLCYHMANVRGNAIDRPRNLAKSVTVE